jgi:hypothetical protein
MTSTPQCAAAGSSVETCPEGFRVQLEDGRTLVCPWTVHPALGQAEAAQRRLCGLTEDRRSVRWPYLWFEVRISHLAELAHIAVQGSFGAPVLLPAGAAVEVA